MAAFFENGKVIIKLSNTESVSRSIYKYKTFEEFKLEESKTGTSSTGSYFFCSKAELETQFLKFLDCENCDFLLDVSKSKDYISKIKKIIAKINVDDFHGSLGSFFDSNTFFEGYNEDFLFLGKGNAEIDDDGRGRLNLKFNNRDKNIELFRNIVIAVFSNLIIEKNDDKNIIYPVIKEEMQYLLNEEVLEINDNISREEVEYKFPRGKKFSSKKYNNVPLVNSGTSEIGEKKRLKGIAGEEYVFKFLKEKDISVKLVSDDKNFPYDILVELENEVGLEVKNYKNSNIMYLSDNEINCLCGGISRLCLTNEKCIWVSKKYEDLRRISTIINFIKELNKSCENEYENLLRLDSIGITILSEYEQDFILINELTKEEILKVLVEE